MRTYFMLILAFLAIQCKAKDDDAFIPRSKNNVVLTVGYGAPSIIRGFLKKSTNKQDYTIMGYGPYMVKGEYFISSKWTVGFNFTYSFSRLSWMDEGYDTVTHGMSMYEYGIEMEDYSLLLRVNYHFSPHKRFDKYIGFGTGYGHISLGTYTEAPVNKFSVGLILPRPLSLETTFGMRYFVTKRLAAYTEIGLGKSWLLFDKYFIPESIIQAGVCYRFN